MKVEQKNRILKLSLVVGKEGREEQMYKGEIYCSGAQSHPTLANLWTKAHQVK